MSVRVNMNEEAQLYELGDDVEGVFIAFVTLPVTSVQGRIAAVLQHQEEHPAETPAPAATTDQSAGYVDNGDGTWTRESDGVKGSFGPNGFAETPAA